MARAQTPPQYVVCASGRTADDCAGRSDGNLPPICSQTVVHDLQYQIRNQAQRYMSPRCTKRLIIMIDKHSSDDEEAHSLL